MAVRGTFRALSAPLMQHALLLVLGSAALACSNTPEPHGPPSSAASEAPGEILALEGSTPGPVEPKQQRRLGEVHVMRFSGSFRSEPLVLREEVVARDDETFTVDYTLDDGFESKTLRVVHALRSERVIRVAQVDAGQEIAASLEDFEALVNQTAFTPDQNRGAIAEAQQTCLVGSKEYECDMKAYRVIVDDEEATLKVARTQDLSRDISGEVVAVDGTIVYHAELIEHHSADDTASHTGVALRDAN